MQIIQMHIGQVILQVDRPLKVMSEWLVVIIL